MKAAGRGILVSFRGRGGGGSTVVGLDGASGRTRWERALPDDLELIGADGDHAALIGSARRPA